MTLFLSKEFLSLFKRSVLGGISLTNMHLLILDGHGSYVILEAIKQAHEFELDMVILLAHTFQALQPSMFLIFSLLKQLLKRKKMLQCLRAITWSLIIYL
jgi:hypothetical protein